MKTPLVPVTLVSPFSLPVPLTTDTPAYWSGSWLVVVVACDA
jgi:hypothetical protein